MVKYLELFSTKKNIVLLSTVYSGLIVLFIFIQKSYNDGMIQPFDMITITSILKNLIFIFQILFYLLLLMVMIAAVLSGYYFFKKKNKDFVIFIYFVLNALNTVFLGLMLNGVNEAISLVRRLLIGDYSVLFLSDSSLALLHRTMQYIHYFVYVSIIIFIMGVLAMMMAKNVLKIRFIHFDFNEKE